MKDYYKLESNNYVDYGIQESPKLGEQGILTGNIIDPSKLPPLVYEHNFPKGEPVPHYLTGGTVLASKFFIDLIQSLGINNYQAFPAVLLNPETQEKRDDYCLFNVIGLLKAADLSASSYDEIMKGNSEGIDLPLLAFKDISIDGKRVHDIDMFRLAEEPISLIVSNLVIDALKANKPEDGWGMVIEKLDVV